MIEPVTRFQKFLRVLADSSADMPEPLRDVEKVCCYACGHLDSYPAPNTRMEKLIASVRDKSIVPPAPVTRLEKYVAAMAGYYMDELPEPLTAEEKILYDVASGEDVTLTGNPLVLVNSMGRQLKECVMSWEPTQEGEGTPSPDNIRPIHGRTQVMVERCGANLLPYVWDRLPDTATSDGLTMVKTPEGTIHVTGTKAGTNWTDIFRISLASSEFFELPAGTYSWGVGVSLQSNYGNMHSSPFTIDTPRIITGAYAAVNVAGTYNKDYVPALVAGSTLPTKVEPYQGESKVLTLPREIYGADLQADGAGQETWKLLMLDGTEMFDVNNQSAKTAVFVLNFSTPAKPFNGTAAALEMVSSHFVKGTILYFDGALPSTIWYNNAGTQMRIAWNPGNKPAATVAEFKEFLAAQYAAGTPVQVAYKLATPIPFTVKGGGIIPTVKGTNTLLTDADTIKATYRCNVRAAEQEINALYTDLLNEMEE